MGYWVNLLDADFVIPADKLDEAHRGMCELNKLPDNMKGGGGRDRDGNWHAHFSWMDENYDQKLGTAKEILTELGFDTTVREDGSLSLLDYDNKAGDEDLFIKVCSAFVKDGSFMQWKGEEGETWMYRKVNGEWRLVSGRNQK